MNLLKIQFCGLGGSWILSALMFVFLVRYLIKLIDHITDNYVSSAIAKISERLKLSQAMAGVTLLALANGATDIITVIVASSDNSKEGDDLAIGSLFGASLFGITFVLAYVIFKSKRGLIREVRRILS